MEGQIVLITGAGSGIGQACALQLAASKCKLILLDKIEERLNETETLILNKYKDTVVIKIVIDLLKQDEIQNIFCKIPTELQIIDVLINNAGTNLGGFTKIENLNIEAAMIVIDLNFKAVVILTNLIVPGMIKRNKGHVVNLSSMYGHFNSAPEMSIYGSTKTAIKCFSSSLRDELNKTNIKVSTIYPGPVDTNIFQGVCKPLDEVKKQWNMIHAEDVATAIMFTLTRPMHVQISDISVEPNQNGYFD